MFCFFLSIEIVGICVAFIRANILRESVVSVFTHRVFVFFEMLRIFIIEPLLFLWVGKSSVSRVFVIFYFTKKYAVLLLSLELNILVNRRPGDVLLFTSEYFCIFHVM